MAYIVNSGEIVSGALYKVLGTSGSVAYNGNDYVQGSSFRGVAGVNIFTVTGDATVEEVLELHGSGSEFTENSIDLPFFPEVSILTAGAIEFYLAPGEQIVDETTEINGFALELIDYPFYSFEITETRL